MLSKKYKNIYTTLNCIEHFLILASAVTGWTLLGILIGITSSAIRLKIWAITAGIKKYQPTIKKKRKKHDKIVLLAKSKLSSIKVLISKALIDSNISHDEFVLINDRLNQYEDMKEEIINLKDLNNSSKILVYLWNNVIV